MVAPFCASRIFKTQTSVHVQEPTQKPNSSNHNKTPSQITFSAYQAMHSSWEQNIFTMFSPESFMWEITFHIL